MKKQPGRYWKITLFHRGKEEMIAEVPIMHITMDGIRSVLRTIFAKR
jgi:hypothetical protein